MAASTSICLQSTSSRAGLSAILPTCICTNVRAEGMHGVPDEFCLLRSAKSPGCMNGATTMSASVKRSASWSLLSTHDARSLGLCRKLG